MSLQDLARMLQLQARAGTGALAEPGFAEAAWARLQGRWQRSERQRRPGTRELESESAARWLVERGLPFRQPWWSHFVAKMLFAGRSSQDAGVPVYRRPDRVEELLRSWQAELGAGRFPRLTWFHAFKSWMSVDAEAEDGDEDLRASHAMTGQFLRRSFAQAVLAPRTDGRPRARPAWATAIEAHPDILSQRVPPAVVSALARGRRGPADELAEALQLPAGGWFWTRLVREVVQGLARQDDDAWHVRISAHRGRRFRLIVDGISV